MPWRDREGREITLEEWARLYEDVTYRVVAESQMGDVRVRTVWEGIDDVAGAMFATGVSMDGGTRWRNAREDARTHGEALTQHHQVVAKLHAG